MNHEPISGCGPGIPRSADTPMEGVRSVLRAVDPHEARLLIIEVRNIIEYPNLTPHRWGMIGRKLQRAADVCMTLSNIGARNTKEVES